MAHGVVAHLELRPAISIVEDAESLAPRWRLDSTDLLNRAREAGRRRGYASSPSDADVGRSLDYPTANQTTRSEAHRHDVRRLPLPRLDESRRARSRVLIQAKGLLLCTLPLRRTAETRLTRRVRIGKRDEMAVTFTTIDASIPLPFGADRALLAWIQTRAFRDGYVVFDDLKDFLATFQLNASGANYARFRERVERIANLAMRVRVTGSAFDILDAPPIERAIFPDTPGELRDLNFPHADGGVRTLRPRRYGLQLSPSFHRYLRESPVPMPLELLRGFHARPMAWDLASLAIWRCYAANRASVIPWRALIEHLGSRDRDRKQLKRSLNRTLESIRGAYPGFPARLLPAYRGLAVEPWRVPRPSLAARRRGC